MKPIFFTPFTTVLTIQNTIKLIAACAVFYWASGPIHAQNTDSKRELAVRAVATQEGPEMNRMLAQLAGSAAQGVIVNWNARLSGLPASKRQSVAPALDAELKKFNEDTLKLVNAEAAKVRAGALLAAYMERFSEEELKQLVALMEAPVFKKYQTISPELGNVYVKAIVDGTRGAVEARSKAFDAAATKITGIPAAGDSAPAASAPPASASSAKPATKKP
jgi:uncharacterized protein